MTTIITHAGQYTSQLRSLHCLTSYSDVAAAVAAIAPVVGALPTHVEANDETYCYRSADDAERDQDGSRAVVVLRTVTRASIRNLRDEARAAGDDAQVALCDAALDGDTDGWSACVDAIADGARG